MTCRELTGFIDCYLADELSSADRTAFESHLRGCADCRRYLDEYRASILLSSIAFSHPDDPPPEDVPEDLIRAILTASLKSS